MKTSTNSQSPQTKRYLAALRSIFAVLKHKVNQKTTFAIQKLQYISINKSPQLLALRCNQIKKKLIRLFTTKMQLYWTTFISNTAHLQLQKRQKHMASLKLKDRAFEAKVKALRVLSRQWKQKKSQTQYKNKYFTPKLQQTPKMIKQKVSEQFYLTLRNILRNKYLHAFNAIKSSRFTKIRNSKGLFLANYLISKRRYWLMFGYERMRLNVLVDRQVKNKQEIQSLDVRLVPVQDSQVQNLKEKQQKLQTALNNVLKEKEQVVDEVDKQTTEMEQKIKDKQAEITQLQEQKQSLQQQTQLLKQSTASWQFSRQQIFYYIYTNFLINLKLWGSMELLDEDNIFMNKSLVLEWLQCPVVDFDLDKAHLRENGQLNEVVESLSGLIREYKRVRGNDFSIDWNDLFQQFFSNYSSNQCNNYEDLFTKIKFTSKMLAQTISQNAQTINTMLQTINDSYRKLTQNESFQVLEC